MAQNFVAKYATHLDELDFYQINDIKKSKSNIVYALNYKHGVLTYKLELDKIFSNSLNIETT